MTVYVAAEDLEAGLTEIRMSPTTEGTVELVARRPAEGEREVLEEATLDTGVGLVETTGRRGAGVAATTLIRGRSSR